MRGETIESADEQRSEDSSSIEAFTVRRGREGERQAERHTDRDSERDIDRERQRDRE